MSSITSPEGSDQLDEPLPGVLEAGALVRCGTITTWPHRVAERYSIQLGNRGRLVLSAEVRGRLDLQDGDRIIVRSTMKVPCAWSAPGRWLDERGFSAENRPGPTRSPPRGRTARRAPGRGRPCVRLSGMPRRSWLISMTNRCRSGRKRFGASGRHRGGRLCKGARQSSGKRG